MPGKMKGFGPWILVAAVGTVVTVIAFSRACYYPGLVTGEHGKDASMISTNWKLKERMHKPSDGMEMKKRELSSLYLEDYRPIDPAPSSKASVKPGPTPHSTHLIPYIPQPTPPGPPNPRHGGGLH